MENSQTSMEDRQHTKSSGDKFSFPIMAVQKEFEFGSCATPGSPRSPADHLFLNGRLLPHAFPSQPANTNYGMTYSRSTSRTSSVSSKDSLMSSRSNSTNSRNSSCSSARTSTSETSERKVLLNQAKVTKDRYQAKKPTLTQQYGSSRRWQFITPIPGLNRQVSRSKKSKTVERIKSKEHAKDETSSNAWFGQRIFMSFVSACIECHAIKTSSRVNVSCQEM